MRYSLIAAAVIWGGLAASAAQAMPMAAPAVAAEKATVLQVDYACGRGWHVTPGGDCRPNGWRRGPPPRRGWDAPPPRYRHHWNDDRRGHDGWRRPPPPRW
ncbi:GCG_CRPN prefix-to-repeats domain-containing protein [Rhizobium sp. HT1-10]|uniref:GCG_CRPN prefix-to-repeats domain-containing protein n=1 Tax=Rhizobium sp. HT1-10 TaxID=3111638 RepID=UPI003C2F820E